MKAKELAELLLQYPDFDVEGLYETINEDFGYYPTYEAFTVNGIADIGYSDKVIKLNCEIKD